MSHIPCPPYSPIYAPSVASKYVHIDPETVKSARVNDLRRLYDMYRVCLQRGDTVRAKRAWALLMRDPKGSIDYGLDWRDAVSMVDVVPTRTGTDTRNTASTSTTLEARILQAERARAHSVAAHQEAQTSAQIAFLRHMLATHSRKRYRKANSKSIREPVQVMEELILLMAERGRESAALAELEL